MWILQVISAVHPAVLQAGPSEAVDADVDVDEEEGGEEEEEEPHIAFGAADNGKDADWLFGLVAPQPRR